MIRAFDIGSGLTRALQVTEAASKWRAHVRHIFYEVDGSELLQCAKNVHSNLYAALVKHQQSAMYSVALRPGRLGQDRMMDIGIVRDPEWVGDPSSAIGGFLLWVSSDFAQPLLELIGHYGVADTVSFSLDGGTAIDLQGCLSNGDLFNLVRLAIVELIAAFDISGEEWAEQDRFALASAIKPGYTGLQRPTL